MKRLILFELMILFLATTFESDSPPGWFQQVLPVNDQINDIFFLDSLTGWVVTQGGNTDTSRIMKTINGGNNWVIQNDSLFNLAVIQFLDINSGYAAGGNGRAKFLKTTNGGNLWTVTTPFGSNISDVKDIFYVNKDTGWFCSDDPFGGGIYKTTNGSLNWILQAGSSYQPIKLFFINKDTGWAGSADWKLYRTTNSGVNWTQIFAFTNSIPNLFFTDKDTGYTSSYKTTNGGFNWSAMTNNQGGSGLFFLNGTTGYNCAGFSVLQKTIDGQNWYNQTVPSGNGFLTIQLLDTLKGWSGGSILIHTTDGGGPFVGIQQISNEIPSEYKLSQNYPNPFNPVTNIKYSIMPNKKGQLQGQSGMSKVLLSIFDVTGKEVTKLVNEEQNAGTYLADWNASGFASGLYFYSLIVDGVVIDTRKMLMVK